MKCNWTIRRNLSEGRDKIDWISLLRNPTIFTYDYKKIKDKFLKLGEEILAKTLHRDRIFKLIIKWSFY